MQSKRRRLEQPFREAPSRGYTYSHGRGGGVSTYKQTKQGPKKAEEVQDSESPRKTELEIPGMALKQGIPLVLEQITKMSLHASVSQIEFKEIYQNNILLFCSALQHRNRVAIGTTHDNTRRSHVFSS